ncbi:Phytosulfokine [Artemisia annua]|uniref:Phytosulfokine n=1 Tax=Artemisia annua TaxID=35608 RepID=A0A2U1L6Z4_ARTAN|nr:Phytosulfokine [Artemisia annua]
MGKTQPLGKLEMVGNEWAGVISRIVNKPSSNTIWSVIQRLLFGATVYFVWQERNMRRANQTSRSEDVVFNCIANTVRFKLLGLTLKLTSDVVMAAEIWNITIRRYEYYRKMVDDLVSDGLQLCVPDSYILWKSAVYKVCFPWMANKGLVFWLPMELIVSDEVRACKSACIYSCYRSMVIGTWYGFQAACFSALLIFVVIGKC